MAHQLSIAQRDLLVRAKQSQGRVPMWGTQQRSLDILLSEGYVFRGFLRSEAERQKLERSIHENVEAAKIALLDQGRWDSALHFLTIAAEMAAACKTVAYWLTENGKNV